MQKISFELENKIIEIYNSGKSMKQIGNDFHISNTTVFNVLKRNNIKTRTKGGIYKINDTNVIELYKAGNSSSDIAKKYNVTHNTIINILEKNNIKRDNIYHNINLISDYFHKIDSYDKAYFLGFLITDGSVFGNLVKLEIFEEDKYILETFANKTNNSNIIYKNKSRPHCAFCVKRKEWVDDLKQYGVIPNKTFKTFLPNLSHEMMPHLIRGLIDGDGWITYKSHAIGFCGNYDLVLQLRDFLVNELNVYNVSIVKHINIYQVSWANKKDIIKICNYIYQDKQDCYLIRKFKNFQNIIYVNTEINSDIAKGSESL